MCVKRKYKRGVCQNRIRTNHKKRVDLIMFRYIAIVIHKNCDGDLYVDILTVMEIYMLIFSAYMTQCSFKTLLQYI